MYYKLTHILSLFFLLYCNFLTAQNKKFIEITAGIDALGNITMWPIPKNHIYNTDSLINIKEINDIINKERNAINIINRLSEIGWFLNSNFAIPESTTGKNPANTLIVYYFKKD